MLTLAAPALLFGLAVPQDGGPSTVAFRQACLDATTDALVMNVAAHPDDESARTMIVLRNRHGVRTVTVYSTCGEGGQNAIGREIGPALAAIRVAETRAAAARYGTTVRWLGFPDFGYSKSLEETLAVWGRDATLDAMRAALDAVDPDVVITNHSIDRGHGHHRASFLAILEACRARSAALGREVSLYQRAPRRDDEEQNGDAPVEALFEIDPSVLDPVRGATFARQAHDAWTLHRSQGPWRPHDPTRVTADVWRQAFPDTGEARAPLDRLRSMFDFEAVVTALGGHGAAAELEAELDAFRDDRRLSAHVAGARRLLPELRELRGRLTDVAAAVRVARRIEALERVVIHGSGIGLETWLAEDEVPIGGTTVLRVARRGAAVADLHVTCGAAAGAAGTDGWVDVPLEVSADALADPIAALTRTVVLPLRAQFVLDGLPLELRRDVVLRIAPERELAWVRGHALVPGHGAWSRAFSLEVVHHGGTALDEALTFRAPKGLTLTAVPPRVRMAEGQRHAQVLVKVEWQPGDDAARGGPIEVLARLGDARARLSMQPIALPAGVELPRIALVRGPDDTIETALRDLGLPVTPLDEVGLATAELGAFDTLVLDIRAYHHRPELASHRDRLLAFCRGGGRIVAFYHKEREWNAAPDRPLLAPFALEVGRDRVSEEDAAVEMLEPDHSIWNAPFPITAADFEGWVQERGLNFPASWDAAWTPLVSMHDAGEEPLLGGLLHTRYGRGDYVYCSLALYRQVRIGHRGAARILVNLLWP